MNFNRLRTLSYFLALFVTFQLYSDFALMEFWSQSQIIAFRIIDFSWAALVAYSLLITHLRPPKNQGQIKLFHVVSIHLYLVLQLLWATAICLVEAGNGTDLSTLLITVFALSTIFIIRGLPFFIYTLLSLVVFFIGLVQSNISPGELYAAYAPTVMLFVVALVVNRLLFSTRAKSYHANKMLEDARNELDAKVKLRTEELRRTNDQLMEEIAERKRYEVNLREEKKKAEEADRLKSVFLANMSHEIRTPLNGILGFSDLLNTPDLPADKRSRYFEIIHNNGEQLVKIIDDIMDISMIESNQLKFNHTEFRISQLLPNALEYFKNFQRIQRKEKIVLINDGFSDPDNDLVISDPIRIQQVLYNLLSNAVKFTHEGEIHFGAKYEEGFILLYVEDSGIGVSSELCKTVFERFRQGEESISRTYGGTGLGLSISKGIIERLGGLIWLDLSHSKGSRFCFSVPSLKMKDYISKTAQVEYSSLLTQRDMIITTEKSQGKNTMTYAIKCNDSAITVMTAEQLEWNNLMIEPDIVIVDMPDEPDMNIEICRKLNEQLSRAKVISLYSPALISKEILLELGCYAAYPIPVNMQLLLHTIKRLTSPD